MEKIETKITAIRIILLKRVIVFMVLRFKVMLQNYIRQAGGSKRLFTELLSIVSENQNRSAVSGMNLINESCF
jgi:hypothetical protein